MSKPNILIFMTDQLNPKVLDLYGGSVVMPALNAIAKEGVVFNQATCAYPACSPSRASFITGLYPHEHGISYNVNNVDYPAIREENEEEGITDSDITTEGILYENGWQTHHFGKWHLTDKSGNLSCYQAMYHEHHAYAEEMNGVFEKVRRLPGYKWMNWYEWALPVSQTNKFKKSLNHNPFAGSPLSDFVTRMGKLELDLNDCFDVKVADKTIDCLRNLNDDDPFMVTCSFNYPHDPNVIPNPYYDLFNPDEIELPESFEFCPKRFKNDKSYQVKAALGEDGVREFLRIYYASCRLLDDQIARVMLELKKSGRLENTIVIFTSDHGDMTGSHSMIWKSTSSFYEEIVKVPLIIRYPPKLSPQISELPISLVDIMPTLLTLTDQEIPLHLQGVDMSRYLNGEYTESENLNYRFCERPLISQGKKRGFNGEGHFMIRSPEWKYVRYNEGDEEFFCLKKDPYEINNLAQHPLFIEKKQLLSFKLDEWLENTSAQKRENKRK